ncbi:hypothetical protein [Costertonia aggregata]|uniref:Uncharacterized protein n=1 Tax=Costertonia aggregata TaxID=343403 RepID=A0A7H9APL6_9FLAO|nr:hypothetical protein [Costertonia aggregata]QLG45409.1 hypothetical protein HYG79_08630 [Costertonia aggregata]
MYERIEKNSNEEDRMNERKERRLESLNSNLSIKSNPTTINYVTGNKSYIKTSKEPYFTGEYTYANDYSKWKSNDTFPIFLSDATSIAIPKKVKRNIERLPLKLLKKIDDNKTVAIEKCLIIISNLTSTLFLDDNEYWKSLSSKKLDKQVKKGHDNTYVYKKVINALKYSTNTTVPIIEVLKNYHGTDTYENGVICKQYRLTSEYQNKNIVRYSLKTTECIDKRRNYVYSKLAKVFENPIGKNLISVYANITLPTVGQILIKGKLLAKKKYRNKKGKLLTCLNSKAKDYYSDSLNRTFVEENIKQFNYLTSGGYMIPIVGNSSSGGRVVDSFNLMPSWIRKMCKIDGEEIVELDYSALHPNIAISIFKGEQRYLTHSQLAEVLGVDEAIVKTEHLSFFNKHPKHMIQSDLFHYYQNNEPQMLKLLIEDKNKSDYKNTSRLFFEKEVDIMTSCIKVINSMHIYVLYVYDALYCKKSDEKIVRDVMNKVIIENNVFTQVK